MKSTLAKAFGSEDALSEWKIETHYATKPERTETDRLRARVVALFRVSSKLHGLVARKICRYCLENCEECPMTEYEQLGEELLQE